IRGVQTAEGVGVVVVGDGVAGCATAIALARAGLAPVVLQRPQDAGWRVGETLPPAARPALAALGVWDDFVADAHLPSPGNRSAWGGPEPAELDFIFDPHGPGWHLDRARFDAMLARAAVVAGAVWRDCARPVEVVRDGHSWILDTGGSDRFRARFVVDATGRISSMARRLGARRRVVDRLIGIAALFDPPTPDGARPRDVRTLVEAVETGWWYSAIVPGGGMVAVFMTDADQLDPRAACTPGGWQGLVGAAPLTSARLADRAGPLAADPRVVPAGSSLLTPVAGDGWLAVGDAAATCDPLSSQGILSALQGGRAAADAVAAELGGVGDQVERYAATVRTQYARYLSERAGYYALERRWPGSAFWQRRQQAVTPRSAVRPLGRPLGLDKEVNSDHREDRLLRHPPWHRGGPAGQQPGPVLHRA